MTEYMVFHASQAEDDATGWVFSSTVEAQTSTDAIKKHLRHLNGNTEHNLFVALPARSWKPMSVSIETSPRVKLTEVDDGA